MQALVVVVAHIAMQLIAEFSDGLKAPSMNDIGLERVKERLHVGVLIRGDPDLVGPGRMGSPHAIRMPTELPVRSGLAAIHVHDARAPALDTHEPFDPSATDPVTSCSQCSLEPRAPIRAATPLEHRPHRLEEDPVLFLALTCGPLTPRIVAGPRHAIQRTEARHCDRPPLRVDVRERLGLLTEQNRMAFFRRACSSCSSRCARSSSCSLRISRTSGALGARRSGLRACDRRRPSRNSFRHRDSMNG